MTEPTTTAGRYLIRRIWDGWNPSRSEQNEAEFSQIILAIEAAARDEGRREAVRESYGRGWNEAVDAVVPPFRGDWLRQAIQNVSDQDPADYLDRGDQVDAIATEYERLARHGRSSDPPTNESQTSRSGRSSDPEPVPGAMSGKSDALRLLNVIEQEATRASDKGEWLNAPWTVSLIREIRTALNGEATAERERAERRLDELETALRDLLSGRYGAVKRARAALSDPVPETLEQKRIRNAPEHSEEGWSR